MMLTPETMEWIEKAEGDYRIASRELDVIENPSYEGVCFHIQQCVEKYLKALLTHKNQAVFKTHDLEQLLYKVMPCYPELNQKFNESEWEMLAEISSGAVEVRYPGAKTTFQDAELFFSSGQQFRSWFRQCLGVENILS